MRIFGYIALLALIAAPASSTQHEQGEAEPPRAVPGAAPEGGEAAPVVEAAEPATPGAAETQAAEAMPPKGFVARSMFATDIQNREPLDSITELSNDHGAIFFFTELRDLDGRTVVHRWEWNGTPMAEVVIEVGGPRWRAYSSKNLHESWLGEWRVSVVDESGRVLTDGTFTYVQAEPVPEAPEPAAAEEVEGAPANSADH